MTHYASCGTLNHTHSLTHSSAAQQSSADEAYNLAKDVVYLSQPVVATAL